MSDSEKILMPSIRRITNDCLPLKIFVLAITVITRVLRSGAFINRLSVCRFCTYNVESEKQFLLECSKYST